MMKQGKKHAISAALTAAVLALGVTACAAQFSDVSDSAYYAEPVSWAVEREITKGTSETTFSPDDICTRGQAVTFLWRMLGSPELDSTLPFVDVPKESYYYDAVLWAAEMGITAGTTETTFSPNDPVNRAQMVTFLCRACMGNYFSMEEVPFTDVDSAAYYYSSLQWAVEEGITAGTTETTFSPNLSCTRGQMVTFLYRMESSMEPSDDLPSYDFTDPALAVAHMDQDKLNAAWEACFDDLDVGVPMKGILDKYFGGDTSGAQYREDGSVCAYLFDSRTGPDCGYDEYTFYVDENGNFSSVNISWQGHSFDWDDPSLAVSRNVSCESLTELQNAIDSLDMEEMPTVSELITKYLGGDTSGAQYRNDGTVFAYLFEAENSDPDAEYAIARLELYADRDGLYNGYSCEQRGKEENPEIMQQFDWTKWEDPDLVTGRSADCKALLAFMEAVKIDEDTPLDAYKLPVTDYITQYLNSDFSGAQYREDGTVYTYLFSAESTDETDPVTYIRLAIYVDSQGNYIGHESESMER